MRVFGKNELKQPSFDTLIVKYLIKTNIFYIYLLFRNVFIICVKQNHIDLKTTLNKR